MDQCHGLTPLEKCKFSTFWTSCFYSIERRFFALEYGKRHFTALYCLKKKVPKMAILRPKPWIKPFGKMSIFRLFVVLFFYRIERRFFVLEYRKGHFCMLYCQKKKLKKRPIFGPKPWLNLFGKVSIFKLFEPFFL